MVGSVRFFFTHFFFFPFRLPPTPCAHCWSQHAYAGCIVCRSACCGTFFSNSVEQNVRRASSANFRSGPLWSPSEMQNTSSTLGSILTCLSSFRGDKYRKGWGIGVLWLADRFPDEGSRTGRLFYFVGLVGPLSLQSQDNPSLLNSIATCLRAGKSK